MSRTRIKCLIVVALLVLAFYWASVAILFTRAESGNPWDRFPDRQTITCWWTADEYLGCYISPTESGYFWRGDEFDPSGEGYTAWYASPTRWLVCDFITATDQTQMCWIVTHPADSDVTAP